MRTTKKAQKIEFLCLLGLLFVLSVYLPDLLGKAASNPKIEFASLDSLRL